MKSLIHWAIRNSPAMNTLMIGVLLGGAVSLWIMRREVFPEFDLEIILVTVPYPQASPDQIEKGICQKVEEAVRAVHGIKKVTSVAQEGSGNIVIELEADVPDVQKILSEIRSEVDRIPSFPELAEDPVIKQITLRQPAIRVGVVGPETEDPNKELKLREIAEQVRDDLLHLKSVSQANIVGAKNYQIDIEISESTLREYGLTLKEVARILRRENIELPGGSIKTDSQEVLLRGKNKQLLGSEIEKIPLLTRPGGVVLTVGDLGVVRDEFTDNTSISRINGKPGMVISVDRTSSEDLLKMTAEVNDYVANKSLPIGYELSTWGDRSVDVRDRMELLSRNGLQGLLLVFLILAIFLELRLAFWVALGIPIAILGACGYLLQADQTLNMLTMFAFLMALGIVVDDAIVVGENIYAHRQQGKGLVSASVDGTVEVLPSVIASVCTTIIAFLPLMFVSGVMGKFIAVMPLAVIAMLVISLFESTFILPCHLAHSRGDKARGGIFHWLNVRTTRLLGALVSRHYMPSLRWSLQNPAIVICLALTLLLLSIGFVQSGFVPFVTFPKLDSKAIEAKIVFPDGTPASVTDAATRKIEQTILRLDNEYREKGSQIVKIVHRSVGQNISSGRLGPESLASGAHVGNIYVELVDTSQRSETSQTIVKKWREQAGQYPGAESIKFGSLSFGPGGNPIEFKLLADVKHVKELEQAVEACKEKLGTFSGVFDIDDDSKPGKWEYQLKIKPIAESMGISSADLYETVRSSYFGEEVMRLQRGRHEVKLMVRYPRDERRSLANFEEIRVRTADRIERPLTELADVKLQRGYSKINRIDQLRSITITADVDESEGNAREIVEELESDYMPILFQKFPNVSARWEGQQAQRKESMKSLFRGFLVALLAMYVLLTFEFRSYFQPLIILAIIPFGAIGAILGHWLLGLDLTLFSMFGLVALTGVVVNDSIVLMDFINKRVRSGVPLKEALLDAGAKRFRAVLLTSMTTIAGLMPILTETSFQAQILIPMAASLCFGLMLTTVLILFLVPTIYYVYASLTTRKTEPPEHRLAGEKMPPEQVYVDWQMPSPR